MYDAEAAYPLHPAEIAAREFPRARRNKGYDPHAVKEWLVFVQASFEQLEEESASLRAERDRLIATIHSARERRPSSAVRATLASAGLSRRALGYSTDQVESLLAAAADELARLENRNALLEAELDARGERRELVERIEWLERQMSVLQGPGTYGDLASADYEMDGHFGYGDDEADHAEHEYGDYEDYGLSVA